MKVSGAIYHLPFKYPFTISKGTKTHQPTFVVTLEHMGKVGYGEAPAITYYNISVEKMMEDLEMKKNMIERFAFTDPERYWHYLHHLIPQNPFLVCALDIAAWDLFGKIRGRSLRQLWNISLSTEVLTDYTIGIASVDEMVRKMKEKPWPIYKVKVGTAYDIDIVKALRQETNAVIRVDANAGWTLSDALQIIPELEKLQVELIEQPLAKDDWEGMKALYQASSIPLIADESCVFEADVKKCVDHFHGINIKLTKCSGLTPARRMIKEARSAGLKVMMGCMNESTIGSAAIVQCAPLLDYMDADGPLLLNEDLASGLQYENGRVTLNEAPGLGVELLSK